MNLSYHSFRSTHVNSTHTPRPSNSYLLPSCLSRTAQPICLFLLISYNTIWQTTSIIFSHYYSNFHIHTYTHVTFQHQPQLMHICYRERKKKWQKSICQQMLKNSMSFTGRRRVNRDVYIQGLQLWLFYPILSFSTLHVFPFIKHTPALQIRKNIQITGKIIWEIQKGLSKCHHLSRGDFSCAFPINSFAE